MPDALVLTCDFFAQANGEEPVRVWLRTLPLGAKKRTGRDILTVQHDWPTARHVVKALGEGLYEVRSTHKGNEYRVFFTIVRSTMVLLHGIHKKTQKTPGRDLNLARARQKEVTQ